MSGLSSGLLGFFYNLSEGFFCDGARGRGEGFDKAAERRQGQFEGLGVEFLKFSEQGLICPFGVFGGEDFFSPLLEEFGQLEFLFHGEDIGGFEGVLFEFDSDVAQCLDCEGFGQFSDFSVDLLFDFLEVIAVFEWGGMEFGVEFGFGLCSGGSEDNSSSVFQLDGEDISRGPVGIGEERSKDSVFSPVVIELGDGDTGDLGGGIFSEGVLEFSDVIEADGAFHN